MDNAKPIMPSNGNVGAILDGLELVVTSLLNATVRIAETMTKVRLLESIFVCHSLLLTSTVMGSQRVTFWMPNFFMVHLKR